MKSQNISRQSGGVVIKLKNKISSSVKIFASFLTGLVLCYLLYYLFDVVWNGFFLDWFTPRYTIVRNIIDVDTGETGIIFDPMWPEIKRLLFIVLCVMVVLIMSIVFLTAHIHARHRVEQSVRLSGEMIRTFMNRDGEATEIFPDEYSPISTQMVQIKYAMQHHEQALREEASRKNDLITYLAHDLKTPLTSVIGYLSLINEAPDMPAQQRTKYISLTLDKANRLESLVNEFFEITRYNLQQIVLEKETFDLHYMLIQLADEFYPILNAHGNHACIHCGEDITLYGDSHMLARVFNNILKNAIAYSYADTPIDIRVETQNSQVCISFSNQGKTIPQQKLDTIFEKFFRLDDARTSNSGGAGLGLAIAREIVTLHGGTIQASSQDEITTFQVTLPR